MSAGVRPDGGFGTGPGSGGRRSCGTDQRHRRTSPTARRRDRAAPRPRPGGRADDEPRRRRTAVLHRSGAADVGDHLRDAPPRAATAPTTSTTASPDHRRRRRRRRPRRSRLRRRSRRPGSAHRCRAATSATGRRRPAAVDDDHDDPGHPRGAARPAPPGRLRADPPQGRAAAPGAAASTTSSTAPASTTTKWRIQETSWNGFHSGSECFVNRPGNVSVGGGVLQLTVRKEADGLRLPGPGQALRHAVHQRHADDLRQVHPGLRPVRDPGEDARREDQGPPDVVLAVAGGPLPLRPVPGVGGDRHGRGVQPPPRPRDPVHPLQQRHRHGHQQLLPDPERRGLPHLHARVDARLHHDLLRRRACASRTSGTRSACSARSRSTSRSCCR